MIHRSARGREGWHVDMTSAGWRRSRYERGDGGKGQAQSKERLQTQKGFAADAKTENQKRCGFSRDGELEYREKYERDGLLI